LYPTDIKLTTKKQPQKKRKKREKKGRKKQTRKHQKKIKQKSCSSSTTIVLFCAFGCFLLGKELQLTKSRERERESLEGGG